jgi:hypothetical protein
LIICDNVFAKKIRFPANAILLANSKHSKLSREGKEELNTLTTAQLNRNVQATNIYGILINIIYHLLHFSWTCILNQTDAKKTWPRIMKQNENISCVSLG